MTPLEVLRCATVNGSRIIGRPADLGSIEPGKLADLVIMDKNRSMISTTRTPFTGS